MMRIFLFIITNIAVVATVTGLSMVLGLEPYMTANGINYIDLAICSLLWGMAGSFISLFMSKWIAKKSMGVKLLTERDQLGWIVTRVHQISRTAGLTKMPEVGVFQSAQPNAFATGPSRNNSLVAVSTGLLNTMNKDEVDGVLAHEVAHIANGDMVTMTLIQGIVNAFVIFISRIVVMLMRGENNRGGMASFAIYMVCQFVFGFFGSMITAAFSRRREFRADAGSAKYVGKEKMIASLQALQRRFDPKQESDIPKEMKSMQIAGGGMMALTSTHPPIEARIKALQTASRF